MATGLASDIVVPRVPDEEPSVSVSESPSSHAPVDAVFLVLARSTRVELPELSIGEWGSPAKLLVSRGVEIAARDPVLAVGGLTAGATVVEDRDELAPHAVNLTERWFSQVLSIITELSRPKPKSARGSARDLSSSRDWLSKHAREYPGCWIAVLGNKLLIADPSIDSVMAEVKERNAEGSAVVYFQPADKSE